MLFNSYQFIFCFFPLALLAFVALEHRPGRLQYLLLLAASIAFYAWWDIRFVPLLVGSFTFNYLGARALACLGLSMAMVASLRRDQPPAATQLPPPEAAPNSSG